MSHINRDQILELRNARGWNYIKRHLEAPERQGTEWRKARALISGRLKEGFFIGLIGDHSKGKTQMAADIMLQCSDQLISSEYTTALGFFSELKSTWADKTDVTESFLMDTFCRPKLLVIDEFEKRSDSPWANQMIFELLNRRYGMMRDTLIISNLGIEAFTAYLTPPLESRMNESGGVIVCDWESFRKEPVCG